MGLDTELGTHRAGDTQGWAQVLHKQSSGHTKLCTHRTLETSRSCSPTQSSAHTQAHNIHLEPLWPYSCLTAAWQQRHIFCQDLVFPQQILALNSLQNNLWESAPRHSGLPSWPALEASGVNFRREVPFSVFHLEKQLQDLLAYLLLFLAHLYKSCTAFIQ